MMTLRGCDVVGLVRAAVVIELRLSENVKSEKTSRSGSRRCSPRYGAAVRLLLLLLLLLLLW